MDRRPGAAAGLRRVYERVGATAATHFPKAPDPRILICTRIIHISGHIGSLWSLFSGEVVVLMDGFDGRDYVIPDDAQVLAAPVLAHRLFPAAQADQVLADLLSVIPLPKQRRP